MKRSKVSEKYLLRKIRALKTSALTHRREFRPGQRRFGLYLFLRDIYECYLDLRSKRIANRATRRIAKVLELSVRKKTHPIRILIEAAGGVEDPRQKSRWAQALKYAHGWRQPAEKLEWFFDENGGISGCASKYAVISGTARRRKAPEKDGLGELSENSGAIGSSGQVAQPSHPTGDL